MAGRPYRAFMDHRRHGLALLLAGQPLPVLGRLLTDTTWKGREIAIDPSAGTEVRRSDGWWVLSDEGEATDGHVLRGYWNFRRDEGAINVLYDHGLESSPHGSMPMGRWVDLDTYEGVPNTVGRATMGRIRWAEGIAWIDEVRSLVDQDILRSASTRWIPGFTVRRGELDPSDPLYREPVDGFCGPEEGFVMGSPEQPNEMVENSLTPTPAQYRAHARSRYHIGADRGAAQAARSEPVSDGDFSRLLARVAQDPRAMAFIRAQIDASVARHLGANAPASASSTPKAPRGGARTLHDIIKRT